ncbi:MAG: FHA domain-containing protein [Myxococcota bacterium]
MKIEVAHEGSAPFSLALSDAPVLIGRAPSNDLVVPDEQVSWHHAAVWVERGKPSIRDMGSRNGTFLNGQKVRGAESFGADDVVMLGPTTRLRVIGPAGRAYRQILLEEVDSGVRIPLRTDRFHIGSAEDADLRVETAPARAATLLVEESGEVVLGTDDSEIPLVAGQVFEVAGRRLRIVEMEPTAEPTVEPESDRYRYRLTASLNGAVGPEATLEDPVAGTRYVVDAENRAILLYLLARQVATDLAERKPVTDVGWMSDDDVNTGIWGKGGSGDANSLHVLVYRLRKEIQKGGFDPWFIEKRRRALRIRLRDVSVD